MRLIESLKIASAALAITGAVVILAVLWGFA